MRAKLGAEDGFEPPTSEVMSLVSYRTALLCNKDGIEMGLATRLERATACLQNRGSTIELHQRKRWSARRDSNSRPLAPEASALPG